MKVMVKVFLIYVSGIAVLQALAATETVNGITWTYTVSNGEASVGGGTSSSLAVPRTTTGAIEIPASLGGYPVTSIGSYAFSSCDGLTSVMIPNSVSRIGYYAFHSCVGLTSVHISDLVSWCRIEFSNESNPLRYAKRLYLNGVEVADLMIPDNVRQINSYSFVGCEGLTSVTIPESVTSIGWYAFTGCRGLTSVLIGNGVTNIGGYAFNSCWSLTSVTIPNNVTSIEEYAFTTCTNLTSMTIPDSVTFIGNHAFQGCRGLTSVIVGTGITNICESVFSGCSGLANVTILGNMTSIADDAFYRCDKLKASWLKTCANISAGGGLGASDTSVSLTVTNVVVHYVAQSVLNDAVVPPLTSGIVNIIAEVNAGMAVAITADWAAQYTGFEAKFGSDFTAAVTKPTGKFDGAGKPMMVWQDFVAGTDPTNPDDVFKASITFDRDTNEPIISWTPELSAAEAAKRIYKTFGKVRLTDPDWTEITDDKASYNFFKVTVEMR